MYKWLLLFWVFCAFSLPAETNPTLGIIHVTVIDCNGAAAKPNSTVVIAGGRIREIGPSEIVKIPAGARVISPRPWP
jgi:imidazolonepropionase-like amidohydrolase